MELLVGIAIIAILAAFLLPALTRTKAQAVHWEATMPPPSLGTDRLPCIARKPVHGATRTARYFDMHVDKIKNTDWAPW